MTLTAKDYLMSDDAEKNRLQDRGKGAFLLVNALKLTLILALLPLAAGLVLSD